jgi:hypothetical protein
MSARPIQPHYGFFQIPLSKDTRCFIRELLPGLDPGIRGAVRVLIENRVETFESCEGGNGHSFPVPTVRFYGTVEAGFRALAACIAHGLPVDALRRVWYVLDGEPTGPQWELTFRELVP